MTSLSNKQYLICRKYDLDEARLEEQQRLENMFLNNASRGEIDDQCQLIENISQQIARLDQRIEREERREQNQENHEEESETEEEENGDGENGEEENGDGDNELLSPTNESLNSALQILFGAPLVNQANLQEENQIDESESSSDDESSMPSLEAAEEAEPATNNSNELFFHNPDIRRRFGHRFASAESPAAPDRAESRPPGVRIRRVRNRQSPGFSSIFQSVLSGTPLVLSGTPLATSPENLQNLIESLREDLGDLGLNQNIDITPISLLNNPSGSYEALSELQDVQVPLKKECDAQIPITIYRKLPDSVKKDKNQQCAVCLCDYEKEEEVRHLPCDHVFHTDCISQWFQLNSKCPVCKIDLNQVLNTQGKVKTSSSLPYDQLSGHRAFLNEIESLARQQEDD